MSELKKNLEARYYTDPHIYALERQHIFDASWQPVAPVSFFNEKGDYLALDIAGTKIFVIRDDSGELRAFRNLCRHRGAVLLSEGQGRCRSVRCPYHNWVYGLDGVLTRAPWFEEKEKLNLDDWPLYALAIEIWRGLVFVCIKKSTNLTTQFGDLLAEVRDDQIEEFQWVERRRLVFDANWKIYTDNFVEGYHIPGIHPDFFKAIDFDQFETTASDNLVRMSAPTRGDLFYKGRWLWMWPNWTMSFFEGGMNTSRINPISENRTELVYDFYFADVSNASSADREQIISNNIAVIEQDFDICITTHQNYLSGGYEPGPLSPRHEKGVHFFQTSVKDAIGEVSFQIPK